MKYLVVLLGIVCFVITITTVYFDLTGAAAIWGFNTGMMFGLLLQLLANRI